MSSKVEWVSKNKIVLNKEKSEQLVNFLETLENEDDVQHIYTNFELNDNQAKTI